MNWFGPNRGMRLNARDDLVLRDVRKGNAADLLPLAHKIRAALDNQAPKRLFQRIGLAGSRTGFEAKALSGVEASIHAFERDATSDISGAFFISH